MNKTIPYLIEATALPHYQLQLIFDDGLNGVVDLSKWKGKGVFSYWDDEQNFKNFKITDTKKIEWNDEIDMDPDSFYLKLIDKTFEQYAHNK